MDVLANSVGQTISNLREKTDFLAHQREHYINVRDRLLGTGETKHVDEDDETVVQNGSVYGDIIISSKKIYLNIGYEYFVEKTLDEAMEYVDDKLRLMEEAVKQFALKIEEGEKTLKNINELSKHDDDTEQGFPSMEIREELDAEGNIISSSVTPTPGQKTKSKDESADRIPKIQQDRVKGLDDFEKNLKGRLVSNSKGAEKAVLTKEQEAAVELQSPQIDMNDMYTFADLVQQMDAQEELDEPSFDSENIEYDFESFDKDYNQLATDDDEDEDSDEEETYSMLPGMAAQQAFMEQIRKLRGLEDKNEVEPKNVSLETKSILKKQDDTKSVRPKKTVGFASTLDIYEVQNLKEENKKNVHDFPRGGFIQPSDVDEKKDGSLTTEEFDSELFAKLIGVQGPDELHNKYREEAATESQEASGSVRNKKRVSRFKKERKSEANEETVTNTTSDQTPSQPLPSGRVIADNIVEKCCENDGTGKEGEYDRTSIQDQTSKTVRENEAVSNFVFEKDDVDETDYVVKERASSYKPISNFAKDMKSLKRKQKVKPASLNVLPTFSDDDDDESDDDLQRMEKLQISETASDNKHESESQLFPKEITEQFNEKNKAIRIPNVDYNALGANMDDMARAYTMGIYDSDLDEDPGMVVEKIEDFKEYNKQVEILKDDIKEFKTSNPVDMQNQIEEMEDDNALMTDVTEHEIPLNYSNDDEEQDDHSDLGFEYSNLNESIAIEYSRLKEVINAKSSLGAPNGCEDETSKQFEPIDEFGNPIKTSRFRSQRLKMNK